MYACKDRIYMDNSQLRERASPDGQKPVCVWGMTDAEVLDFLSAKLGSSTAAARAVGVTRQAVTNWRATGISASKRAVVWVLANAQGAGLPDTWLLGSGGRRRVKAKR